MGNSLFPLLKGDYGVNSQELNVSNTGRALSSSGAAERFNYIANAPSKYIFVICSDHAKVKKLGRGQRGLPVRWSQIMKSIRHPNDQR